MSLTRLAASRHIPGAQGVFLTRNLKKFTPIEIAPASDAIAPPYLENLVTAPLHTISLRRFLALRHQFSTGQYFNVASARGWYLVVPSSHAPLPDTAGLAAWRARHHHQYLCERKRRKRASKTSTTTTTTAAPSSSSSSSSLSACVNTVPGQEAGRNHKSEADEELELEEENERSEEAFDTATSDAISSRRLLVTPLSIAEEHLFEINDGVPWELPPRDDLACPAYWKHNRERMYVYEDTSVRSDQEDGFLSSIKTESPEQMGATEQERYAQQLRLFRSLARKANVKLNVDDSSSLLTLVPLIDLNEGDELLLHYGREWWSQRLLASVFMSVADTEMRSVRWIESLFSKPTDVSRPFPLLCPAVAHRKGKIRLNKDSPDREKKRQGVEGKSVLFNTATQCRATDMEALVFAVRRSCVDRDFFSILVGDGSKTKPSVFDISQCEANLPMRHLRRALLRSLHGQTEVKQINELHREMGEDEDNDDGSIVL